MMANWNISRERNLQTYQDTANQIELRHIVVMPQGEETIFLLFFTVTIS